MLMYFHCQVIQSIFIVNPSHFLPYDFLLKSCSLLLFIYLHIYTTTILLQYPVTISQETWDPGSMRPRWRQSFLELGSIDLNILISFCTVEYKVTPKHKTINQFSYSWLMEKPGKKLYPWPNIATCITTE